jgi:geranylgeranyl pyrophosphate synthase
LEVRFIGRNNDLIGQILEIFEDKRKNKKKEKCLVKGIADEQKYSRGAEKKGSELTSGTVKLMAIFSQGRRSKTWGIGEEGLR